MEVEKSCSVNSYYENELKEGCLDEEVDGCCGSEAVESRLFR